MSENAVEIREIKSNVLEKSMFTQVMQENGLRSDAKKKAAAVIDAREALKKAEADHDAKFAKWEALHDMIRKQGAEINKLAIAVIVAKDAVEKANAESLEATHKMQSAAKAALKENMRKQEELEEILAACKK